jgi:TonB family protein
MSKQSDPLSRTRPLADPLRAFTFFLVLLAVYLLALAYANVSNVPRWGFLALYPLVALSASCTLLSVALLVAPYRKANAIYLRAFRTDRATAKLRLRLAAILGPKFRLSGIRPPNKAVSIFMRFLLPYLFVLRYAGSKFMELEAGDDWMVRLLKTYQKVRLVFLDLRTLTPYVHQEIQMTLASVGIERCIFLIDGVRTPESWQHTVATIVGPEADPGQFHLLDVESPQMEADLRTLVATLPPGVAGERELGRRYVLDHVSEQQLRSSRGMSPVRITTAILAALMFLALPTLWGPLSLALAPMGSIGVAIAIPLVVLAVPMFRAIARTYRLARARYWASAALGLVVVVAAVFLAVAPQLVTAIAMERQLAEIGQTLGPAIAIAQQPIQSNAADAPSPNLESADLNSQVKPKVTDETITIPETESRRLIVTRIEPMYPPLAIQAGIGGVVKLKVRVRPEGSVESVKALSGNPLLIPSAQDAVRKWQFQPYIRERQIYAIETTVTLRFSPKERGVLSEP